MQESELKLEELVQRAESLPDPHAREIAVDLIRAVLDLHGSALKRLLEIVVEENGVHSLRSVADDELISSILLLHELHPDDVQTRVDKAVEKLRRVFVVRGGEITLLGAGTESVHILVSGVTAEARQLIEDVIYEAAPEAGSIVIEGLTNGRASGFVPLASLQVAHRP